MRSTGWFSWKTYYDGVSLCSYYMLMRQIFDPIYGLSSCKRLPPISDHLGLTSWVVTYGRFDCKYIIFCKIKGKGEMCIKVKWPIRLMLASDFSSMKWLVVFLFPLDGMPVHCWINPSPTLIFLGGERHCKVSSPIMQYNITSQAWKGGFKPWLLNLEARALTIPPTG